MLRTLIEGYDERDVEPDGDDATRTIALRLAATLAQRLDVIAALRLISPGLDHLVGDRHPVDCLHHQIVLRYRQPRQDPLNADLQHA